MSLLLHLTGIIAPTGSLQRLRIYNPDGSTLTEVAMTEETNAASQGLGIFDANTSLNPTPPDTAELPYEAEARQVTAQTAAAFDASTVVRLARGAIGFVRNGQWVNLTPGDVAAIPVVRNVSVTQS